MPIRDVCSPISKPGSKVGSMSSQPLSPGARSSPSRGDQGEPPTAQLQPPAERRDRTVARHQEPPTAQPQPQALRRDRGVAHQEDPIPGSVPVVIGPSPETEPWLLALETGSNQCATNPTKNFHQSHRRK